MEESSKSNEHIILTYNDHIRQRSIKIILIGSCILLPAMPLLFYADVFFNRMPFDVFYWRFYGFIMAFISVIIAVSPLKKNARVIHILFHADLFTVLLVVYAIMSYIQDPLMLYGYLSAVLLGIFLVFLVSSGGYKSLMPMYVISLLIAILLYKRTHPLETYPLIISLFTNPILATISLPFFAEIFEKRRFNLFKSSMLLEEKNNIFQFELDLARNIQKVLVPLNPPEVAGLRISTVYKPVEKVGGDFFDFLQFKEPELTGIFISDVSGHGVPAAFVTSIIKTLIESSGAAKTKPGMLLSYINRKCFNLTGENFITAFYAVYNTTTRVLSYARAGHNYPYLIRDGEISELHAEGTCLGLFPELEFPDRELQLRKGDSIILYTDGLVESINDKGTIFEDYFKDGIYKKIFNSRSSNFAESTYDELLDFIGENLIKDDVCIIVLDVE